MTNSITDFAQPEKFQELADKMLCNIRVFQADSITLEFLKTYVPILATKPKPGGGWIVRAGSEFPLPQHALHSLYFDKHPFINFKFNKARLDIYTQERNNKAVGLDDYQIWFFFNNKQDAENTFDRIYKMFTSVCTTKTIVDKGTKKIATFKNGEDDWQNTVQFVLTKDELYDGGYKIFFRIGIDDALTEDNGVRWVFLR
jgi:hypothetical protein